MNRKLSQPGASLREFDRRPVFMAIVLLNLVVAALAGYLSAQLTLRLVQIVLGLVLFVYAVLLDHSWSDIPRICRPASVALGSLLISSVATWSLSDDDYSKYFVLWILQVVGFGIGFSINPHLGQSAIAGLSSARLRKVAMVVFFACLGCAIMFFATQGVPSLGGNLEQSRIDAAEGGSGYIRMLAFLMPTVTVLLVVTDGKRAWPFVAVSVLFMIGVGNRVPFLYFVIPLLVLVAVCTQSLNSRRLVLAGISLLVLVGLAGAYRISTQPELKHDPAFRSAIFDNNYAKIGLAAINHYAEVVPQNAILTKSLVDRGVIEHQFGLSYFTLFISGLPGRQLSPDMLIREASGKQFIGGGIPPTLAGEGYL